MISSTVSAPEAAENEQAADRANPDFERQTAIKRAQIAAQVEEEKAKAAQAGPLAEAKATQEVISQQTSLAEKEAALTDKRLESEVRRPADAEAYKQRTLSEAARDTTKFNTEAETNRRKAIAAADADAQRLTASAAADATKLKADGDAYAAKTVADADALAINARTRLGYPTADKVAIDRETTAGQLALLS